MQCSAMSRPVPSGAGPAAGDRGQGRAGDPAGVPGQAGTAGRTRLLGHTTSRGRKVDLMWRTRMLLLKRYGRLTVEQEERVLATVGLQDFWGEVTGAYLAYQEALIVFDRVGTAGLRTAMNGCSSASAT